MTAQRWWVRLGARWLARVDGVSGQLRLAMLGLTGISTMTLTLRDAGLGEYAPAFTAIIAFGALGFAWLYSEGGVWNQMSRDRADMSNNYADPNGLIQSRTVARAIVAGIEGEELSQQQREAINAESRAVFANHRDGVDLEDSDEDSNTGREVSYA